MNRSRAKEIGRARGIDQTARFHMWIKKQYYRSMKAERSRRPLREMSFFLREMYFSRGRRQKLSLHAADSKSLLRQKTL